MKRVLGILTAVLLSILLGCASTPVTTEPVAEVEQETTVSTEPVAEVEQETAVTTEPAPVYHLVVLHTNDHHGHPVKFYNYPAPDLGGLPARAALIRQVRSENDNVLVLDAGDINTGRPESNFFKAEPDILGYNACGYDALALGNHEFDNPLSVLQDQIALADFPFLCANVLTSDGSYLDNVLPYIIKDFGDLKVAVFGMIIQSTPSKVTPDNIRGLVFRDEVETARELVPELESRADVVIALVHMGIYDTVEEGSMRLAAEVPGIDLIVDGHTHTMLEEPVMVTNNATGKQVPVVQAWQWGLYLGRVDMDIQGGEVTSVAFEPIPVNLKTREKKDDGSTVYHFIGEEISEDKALVAKLQPYVDKVDAMLNEKIGTADGTFLNTDVRAKETALGDMVSDSMKWFCESMGMDIDFAIQNGGGIRADLPEGDITKRLIYEILPFDNSVYVLTLKGSDVVELFDYIAVADGGAFPQVSEGVSFTINHVAGKSEDVLIGGEPIDPDRLYHIATNSFMGVGGDDYTVFLKAVETYDTSMFQRDAMIEYIQSLGGAISPEVAGRYSVIENETSALTTVPVNG